MRSKPPLKATRPPTARVILLRQEAPAQPSPGEPCNGCGVCCAAEPCPLGILVSGRRQGRCRALHWDTALSLYRCGMVSQPQRLWPWLPLWARASVSRWARRWISSASGCDATLVGSPAPR
ncbi:hypothetical protein [Ideonella paludis]|uniref:4Fe-4S ferredoxin-type domain-containing protein n=1 Tax=Ideonella paludis TaxID=1233411 RepID=A0ABS5DUW6_9BURK|nr:hypothetical protein [Ideonella paludis]MBQ0934932.1 hypothetical protein [Ideonella paludis]